MAEGPGADCPREGLPLLLSLGQPGLPQGPTESSPPYLAGKAEPYQYIIDQLCEGAAACYGVKNVNSSN